MEDIIRDYVKNIKKIFREEVSNQAKDVFVGIEELTYNVELFLTLLNELDKLDDDTFIEVFYNPMGLYQYKIIGDDENED